MSRRPVDLIPRSTLAVGVLPEAEARVRESAALLDAGAGRPRLEQVDYVLTSTAFPIWITPERARLGLIVRRTDFKPLAYVPPPTLRSAVLRGRDSALAAMPNVVPTRFTPINLGPILSPFDGSAEPRQLGFLFDGGDLVFTTDYLLTLRAENAAALEAEREREAYKPARDVEL